MIIDTIRPKFPFFHSFIHEEEKKRRKKIKYFFFCSLFRIIIIIIDSYSKKKKKIYAVGFYSIEKFFKLTKYLFYN